MTTADIISSASAAIGALASVATLWIAAQALSSWRAEHKAQRLSAFLDDLLASSHAFGTKIAKVVAHVRSVQISFEAHVPSSRGSTLVDGANEFLSKGEWKSDLGLKQAQDDMVHEVQALRSLLAKGDALGFEDYSECVNALRMLILQYDRSLSITALLGSNTWNLENPEVVSLVEKVVAIEPKEMLNETEDALATIHRFVKSEFQKLY